MKKTIFLLLTATVCLTATDAQEKNIASEHSFSAGITTGLAITDISFKTDPVAVFSYSGGLANATFPSAFNPVAGAYIQYYLSGKKSKHIAEFEAMYHAYTYTSDSLSLLTERGVYDFSLAYLRNMLSYRYAFPAGKLSLCVFGGFTFGLNLKLEEAYKFKSGNTNQAQTLKLKKPSNDIGFLGGAGIQYGKLGFDIRYCNSNPFTNNANLQFSARASSVFLLVRYNIFSR